MKNWINAFNVYNSHWSSIHKILQFKTQKQFYVRQKQNLKSLFYLFLQPFSFPSIVQEWSLSEI